MLRLNIPEMLFIHYHGFMIYSVKGQIKIENAQDPATFLHLIRSNNMKKPEFTDGKKKRSTSKQKMSVQEKNRQSRMQNKTDKEENKKKENHKFDPEIYWNAPMGVYKK